MVEPVSDELIRERSVSSSSKYNPNDPCICSLGTGEIVHIIGFTALNCGAEQDVIEFETIIQRAARDFYSLKAGLTDVRVCHPMSGAVVFVLTFLGLAELQSFQAGPEKKLRTALKGLARCEPIFPPRTSSQTNGTTTSTETSAGPPVQLLANKGVVVLKGDGGAPDSRLSPPKTAIEKNSYLDKATADEALGCHLNANDYPSSNSTPKVFYSEVVSSNKSPTSVVDRQPSSTPSTNSATETATETTGAASACSDKEKDKNTTPQDVAGTIHGRPSFRLGPMAGRGQFITTSSSFQATGALMPSTHSLQSLLQVFVQQIIGQNYRGHNVKEVAEECKRWFPRRHEWEKYVSWDEENPKKYTRNLIMKNDNFDCLLMCWPPHCQSSIHCHDRSSCWVVAVAGEVVEVQYQMPKFDRQFLEHESRDSTTAKGKCAPLKRIAETIIGFDAVRVGYANNEIALHRIENRTDQPAYTMHIYAPGLRKIKIFQEDGQVTTAIMCAAEPAVSESCGGIPRTGSRLQNIEDCIIDVDAWNASLYEQQS
ncbi:unnamed protein product [Amoebophrya sp. A120]|nr:unnamed protein product [Amoebophrya sp. A120]|eukprot:GSA120T00006777001.1